MSGRFPFDRSDLDDGQGRKLALQERSNPAENDEVLSFDPHPKACFDWSKDGAGVLEGEELVRAGEVDRLAENFAAPADFLGNAMCVRERDEGFSIILVHLISFSAGFWPFCNLICTRGAGQTESGSNTSVAKRV